MTDRTRLKRHAERGNHERATIEAIIDEALLCHVGFVHEGAPCVLPMAHARIGDRLYLHGAQANRMLRALLAGRCAVTFSLLDGLVLARSAMHHSVNFRSVALFAQASEVSDEQEKLAALAALLEHMAPGRSTEARPPNAEELRATLVLQLPIHDASAKLRSGPPLDAAADLGRDCWAGVLPLRLQAGDCERDPQLTAAQAMAPSVHARAADWGNREVVPHEWRRAELLVSTERARLDLALVHEFLAKESYWAQDTTRARVERGGAASLCFGLYRGATQLGFARVVTDYTRAAYLVDVFVVAAERGMGLGSWLIECVLSHPELTSVERWLLGTRDAHTFYERFGFRRDDAGRLMVRIGDR